LHLKEVEMTLRILRHCVALLILTCGASLALHAQSAAEYGMMTGNSAALGASGRPLIPFPNFGTQPAAGSTSGTPGVSGPPGVAAGTAEAAAKSNLQFFQTHAGPDAGQLNVHVAPVQAQAWIDGRFVGPTPLDLKLAPGHHQLLVRAVNMQATVREFDVTAKQAQTIDLALKSAYQSQVVMHWPAPQK
jgi:hypothetical protein